MTSPFIDRAVLLLLLLLVFLGLSSCGALRLSGARNASGDASDGERCIFKEWGSTAYLEGVQLLPTTTDHLPFKDFDHGSQNREGLFVYPKADVAMCVIEKNGCSSWLTIWNKLVLHKPNIKSPWYGVVGHFWSEENAAHIFNRNKTTRILWVRDPLERFLSGFLDKCLVNTDLDIRYRRICSFHTFNNASNPPGFPLSKVQEWFKEGNTIADVDSHFTPQARHCELKRRLAEYNVIGLMTKANFARDAGCILERAGLASVNEGGGIDGRPFFSEPVNPSKDEWQNREVLKRFYTRDFAEFLLDVFKEDYELFRMKKPDWVKQATGVWFHTPAKEMKGLRPRKSKAHLKAEAPEAEEDDLLTLASKAGFHLSE